MTTPIVNEPVRTSRDSEIYDASTSGATREAAPRRPRWTLAIEGAILGVAFWILLFTLGLPWVFHIGAFDGLLPATGVGILVGVTRWRVVLQATVVALSVLVIVVAFTPVVVEPARSLIRVDPLPARADAIVVLAGGTSDDGLILPQATDRLLKGLELLNRGVAPTLILSREADSIGTRLVTSRDDHERIVSLVRDARPKVVFPGLTHSTRDEAMRVATLFRARGWKRVVVVTSPLHTRRACGTFEKLGIVVSCAAAESREIALNTLKKPEDRVRAFQIWLYETAGTLRYRQLGWL
ncbi:MAG TPA: YdcF family protein [Rhodothermia bacterium]|nr:YdcF family protein [Rhodothermia bacterium]